MYIGLHVKYPVFLSDYIQLEVSRQIFGKYSNIKFHENPSGGSRVVPCGRPDMTKPIAFRNFANAHKTCLEELATIQPYRGLMLCSRLGFKQHIGQAFKIAPLT
jgi:hypothetical protein